VQLRFGHPVAAVVANSLLEEDGAPPSVEDNVVQLTLKPFEIVKLRVLTRP